MRGLRHGYIRRMRRLRNSWESGTHKQEPAALQETQVMCCGCPHLPHLNKRGRRSRELNIRGAAFARWTKAEA